MAYVSKMIDVPYLLGNLIGKAIVLAAIIYIMWYMSNSMSYSTPNPIMGAESRRYLSGRYESRRIQPRRYEQRRYTGYRRG